MVKSICRLFLLWSMSIVQMASAIFLNDSVDNIEFGSSSMNSEVPH